MQSLFVKYGGHATVSRIVNQFYFQLLSSAKLSNFFSELDMEPLIEHQIEFVSAALGKRTKYKGRTMIDAHRNLNISNSDFDEVSSIFLTTLADNGFSTEDLGTVNSILSSLKSDIVSG